MTLPISPTQHPVARLDPTHPNALNLQKRLMARGYDLGPTGADGIFGTMTGRAVIRFKQHWGLRPRPLVGPITWGKLAAPMAVRAGSASFAAKVMHDRLTGADGHPRMRYVFGFEIAALSIPVPRFGDCSESVQWAVFQATAHESGQGDAWVDGSANQFAHCQPISVGEAMRTRGALLFVAAEPDDARTIHHVVMSLGDGHRDVEARSAHLDPSCGVWPDAWQPDRRTPAQRFTHAGLCPALTYS